jgi:dephospho-CoA kinase
MRLIGVTGPSGAGKGALCELLKKRGIVCIDADAVYHSLLVPPSECLDALRGAFGESVFLPDGSLDRAALGRIVFAESDKLELLNSTVLSYVLAKFRIMISELEATGEAAVVIDAPTLIESGFDKECDVVISVLAPVETRLERIMRRDSISREKALLRIKAQKSDEFYISHSDAVVHNDGSQDALDEALNGLLKEKNILRGASDD